MRKIISILFFILLFGTLLKSQNLISGRQTAPECDVENFRAHNNPNFKQAWGNVLDGNNYFDKGEYDKALKFYLIACENKPDDAPLNFRIGKCYSELGQIQNSIKFFITSLEIDSLVFEDLEFNIGILCQKILKYNIAKEYFQLCLKRTKSKEAKFQCIRGINECDFGINALENPVGKEVILGENINSNYDELYPLYDQNNAMLLFLFRQRTNIKSTLKTYCSKFIENSWTKSVAFEPTKLFKKFNEYRILNISDDGKDFIVTGTMSDESSKDWKFYLISNNDKQNSMEVLDWINIPSNIYSVAFNSFMDTLYFSYFAEKDRIDMYFCTIDLKNKTRGSLIKLPDNVDTKLAETVFSYKNDTLYFSSNGLIGMGGYDIYYAVKENSNNIWSDPVNLGYPINSPFSDFGIAKFNGNVIISSDRKGSLGGKDLFLIDLTQ